MKKNNLKSRQLAGRKRNLLLAVLGIVIVAALVVGIIHATHLFSSKPVDHTTTTSAGQNTKGEQSESSTSKSGTSTAGSTSTSDSSKGSSAPTTLQAPTGDFVSAHHVTLSTSLGSVCNTAVGASCSISFSSAGVVKSLAKEAVDSNGTAYWDSWTPKGIGLTAGTWKITATASLGQQELSASDVTDLVVSE
jgi:cytoskeletal protein RodZ